MKNPLKILTIIRNGDLYSLARDYAPVIENAAIGADIIIGSGIQCIGASVSEALGIPYRHVLHFPAFFPSKYHPPLFIPWRNLPYRMNTFLWKTDTFLANRIFPAIFNPYRKKKGLRAIKNFWGYMARNILLAADREIAPLTPDCNSVVFHTGYWHLEEDMPLDPMLEKFLATGPPPVYFGFGSMTDPHPRKTIQVLLDTIENSGIRAILSRGWSDYGISEKHPSLFLAGPQPHRKLFPHVCAVVHHGGAGTTYTAARAGVPQILIPHLLDQFYWADRITKAVLGPPSIPRFMLSSKKLSNAINHTVNDSVMKQNAETLGAVLQKKNSIIEAVEYLESSI